MTQQTGMIPRPAGGVMNFGSQELDAGDFIPPRVKILQPMSAETTGDAKPGDLYNTLTAENYGPSLKVVPITPLKQRVFLFRDERRQAIDTVLNSVGLDPLSEGDGLKCRSLDMVRGVGEPGDQLWRGDSASGQGAEQGCRTCPLSQWRGNRPPYCTETYNVAGISDSGDFVILSMAKSGAKEGKKWFSMIRMKEGAPWTRMYELTTREQKNELGRFWTPLVRQLQDATPTDLMAQAARWFEQLRGRVIDVTPVPEDDAEDVPDDTADLAGAAF